MAVLETSDLGSQSADHADLRDPPAVFLPHEPDEDDVAERLRRAWGAHLPPELREPSSGRPTELLDARHARGTAPLEHLRESRPGLPHPCRGMALVEQVQGH